MNRTLHAHVLYALLDAAHDAGRLSDPVLLDRWRELRLQFDHPRVEAPEPGPLHELLAQLNRTGVLDGTWIQSRWLAVTVPSVQQARPRNFTSSSPSPVDSVSIT